MTLIDLTARNALLKSLRDRIIPLGALLEIFAGELPAELTADLSAYTVLASRHCHAPVFHVPVGATMHGVLNPGDYWEAAQTGRATFYRLSLPDGTPLLIGPVGAGVNFDMRLASVDLEAGQAVQPTGWVVELAD